MTRFATGPDGNRVAYEVTGAGPDVVLVHGITEQRGCWDPIVERLSNSHRVINVDLRGHGESEPGQGYALDQLAADVRAVADEVGAEQPSIVGHSLGGFVASVYAAANPVGKVVNVDQPLALAGFKEQLTPAEPLLRGEAFETVMIGLFAPMMASLPAEERQRISDLRRPVQEVVLGVWDTVFSHTEEQLDALIRDLLADLDAPYLAIHGEDPGELYVGWLSDLLPQAAIEVWAGNGHYPHLGEPKRFVERLRSFLEG